MASREEDEEQLALSAAYEDDTPTPLGWKRKLVPRIGKGLVPARTDVIFITPNGEEFTSRAQLQRYLKAHKGGPDLSEFIWLADDTPRRSTRSRSMAPAKFSNVELSSKGVGKRKHAAKVSHEKMETGEAERQPKEQKKISGKRTKNARSTTGTGGKSGEKDFSASPMSSVRRQRSPKVVNKRNRAATGMKSVKMDGEEQTMEGSKKVEGSMEASNLSKADDLVREDTAVESQDKDAQEKTHVLEEDGAELDAVVGSK